MSLPNNKSTIKMFISLLLLYDIHTSLASVFKNKPCFRAKPKNYAKMPTKFYIIKGWKLNK